MPAETLGALDGAAAGGLELASLFTAAGTAGALAGAAGEAAGCCTGAGVGVEGPPL